MLQRFGHWAATLGPFGIFLIALSDSALIPMPQGVDFLVLTQGIAAPHTAYWAALAGTLGSLIGCLILYSMARKGGRVLLEKKASAAGIEKMRRQVERWGALVLVLPTMIPLPLPTKLFVIASGVFQMRLLPFIIAISFARFVRYFGEAWLARRYGDGAWDFLKQNAALGIVIGVAVVALFYLVNRWSSQRLAQGQPDQPAV